MPNLYVTARVPRYDKRIRSVREVTDPLLGRRLRLKDKVAGDGARWGGGGGASVGQGEDVSGSMVTVLGAEGGQLDLVLDDGRW